MSRQKNRPLPKLPLLFDGAMGTFYSKRTQEPAWNVDQAVLSAPEEIISIHEAYLHAGARALKTSTFSLPQLYTQKPDLAAEMVREAVRCARKAIRGWSTSQPESSSFQQDQEGPGEEETPFQPLIFADLGPVFEDCDPASVYQSLFEQFLKEGIHHFLLETLPSASGLDQVAAALKAIDPEAFLLVSFACASDGLSAQGIPARLLLEEAEKMEGVDAIGLNCKCGPSHMASLVRDLPSFSKPLSIMPNAGYPTVTSRSALYQGDPQYFASSMERIFHQGAMILGGCCGTEPAHIEALARRLNALEQERQIQMKAAPTHQTQKASMAAKENLKDGSNHPQKGQTDKKTVVPAALARGQRFPAEGILQRLATQNRKAILVELDPPATDRILRFMEGVSRLHQAGADVLTIADNPIGRPRADSSILACKVHRETGIEVLPHMTCRDRNLNAIKALLLGLSMEDIHQVLLVTGDPLPLESRQDVKAVFSMNSRTLASFVSRMDEETCEPFHLYGALDLNARNFDIQLSLARKKEEAGMEGFLTQPVFSRRALENLKRARKELAGKIYGGIMPIVSYRNACFLKNEITGMDIPEELALSFQNKSRKECETTTLAFCLSTARQMEPWVDGYYLMTPFQRIELMEKLIQGIHAQLEGKQD